jgi:hypothetical protein
MTIAKVILAAGLALGVTAPLATPAAAQTTIIRRDDNGDRVIIRRHSDRGWHHGRWDRPVYGFYGRDRDRCRTVTVRRENEDGDVMVRRIRKCR